MPVKDLKKGLLAVLFLCSLSRAGTAADIFSQASGPWSQTTTWTPAQVPTAADRVTILPAHQVTVDITTATASTTTIRGTLSFSRIVNSSFTLVAGSMTVLPGGLLDIGTEPSPIPSSVFSHLVLSYGSSPGQYGLEISTGGNFSVRGSTKTPAVQAVAGDDLLPTENELTLPDDPETVHGWRTGDIITVSPTDLGGAGTSEERRIIAFPGSNRVQVDSNFSQIHRGTGTIWVGNLTRNVLVRSSGTTVTAGGNSAYLRSLSQSVTSFNVAYGEFAYLGASNGSRSGVSLDGPAVKGQISSSTFRNGHTGLYLSGTSEIVVDSSLFFSNNQYGLKAGSVSGCRIMRNHFYENGLEGANLQGHDRSLIAYNQAYSNQDYGIFSLTFGRNVVLSNRIYSNVLFGLLPGLNDINVDNRTFLNQDGIRVAAASLLIGHFSYRNSSLGLYATGIGSGVFSYLNGALGYGADGTSFANAGGEVGFQASQPESGILKSVQLNPQAGVAISGFNIEGNYLLSYDQSSDTGTLRIWGDYLISGSTLSLQYSQRLYRSTHTAVVLVRGSGHQVSAIVPSDGAALSELILITAIGGGNWKVEGSSSGVLDASFSCAAGTCGFSHSKLSFNLSVGAVNTGDLLAFATISATQDANRQKRLLFGPSHPSLNRGRSKLTISSTGGLELIGVSGEPAIMDRFSSGSTYYTFVGSGAFTASFSTINNLDSDGLQLTGSRGVSLSNTSFDFMGVAEATNSFITARTLTSAAALANLDFKLSRSTSGAESAYNVRVDGADSGLSWTITSGAGGFWGEGFDFDPGGRIQWTGNIPPTGPAIAQIHPSSVAVSFGLVGAQGYVVEASTTADFTGLIRSSASPSASTLAPQSLIPNTTYFLRAGALWGTSTTYADANPALVATLAFAPSSMSLTGIGSNGFTVNWSTNGNPPGTQYEARISTDINFGLLTSSKVASSSSTSFGSLSPNATYFIRVRAVSHGGIQTSEALGVAITNIAASVITISADKLAGVWYSASSAIFFAQGPGVSRFFYRIDSNPANSVTTGDGEFNGFGLTAGLSSGINYFHVLGTDGGGTELGRADFGPIQIDNGLPTIAFISAQKSAADPTAIPDNGATLSALPRLSWPAGSAASGIQGYSVSVSTNGSDDPPPVVGLTFQFYDAALASPGFYFAKVRALNRAGTWGPSAQTRFTFSTVPQTPAVIPKNNHFNPTRGECFGLEVHAAEAGSLKIELFTLLGDRLGTILNQPIAAGIYNHAWCGRNADGSFVAHGVYILHIQAPGQKRSLKAIVSK